jgi:hypothetical protein
MQIKRLNSVRSKEKSIITTIWLTIDGEKGTHPDSIILPNCSHIYKSISTSNKTTDELFHHVLQLIIELSNESFSM